MDYISRIVDTIVNRKMTAFNAVNIVGPKGCGKTRTAKERCETIIEFQDEDKREGYLAVAETAPRVLLNRFIEKYHPSIAYKFVTGNIGVSDQKITLPHYKIGRAHV